MSFRDQLYRFLGIDRAAMPGSSARPPANRSDLALADFDRTDRMPAPAIAAGDHDVDTDEFIPVTRSSNVAGFKYDHDQRWLYVWFLNGSIYVYYDVPLSVYDDFFTANSFGSFVAQNLRDIYRCGRVR